MHRWSGQLIPLDKSGIQSTRFKGCLAVRLRERLAWAFSESKTLALKEILKWLLVSSVTLVGGWLLAVVRQLFDTDSPLASAPIWVRLKAIAIDFSNDPLTYSLALLQANPGLSILGLVLVALYAILFILWRRTKWSLREAGVERALAIQAGIGGRWPHARTNDIGGAPWADLCAEIGRYDNGLLFILGANGVETFGRPGSPLFEVMQNFLGQTRVILIDSNSTHAAGRAATVSQSVAEYKKAVATSVKRLRDLRHQQHSIEGRFYDGLPNWKMIITSRTAWIQYYVPGQHVAETPVWRFDSTEHGSGLYHLFAMEFERVWRRCAENAMSLH
jgi:hypothetical protein